jgi:hypothetical protein
MELECLHFFSAIIALLAIGLPLSNDMTYTWLTDVIYIIMMGVCLFGLVLCAVRCQNKINSFDNLKNEQVQLVIKPVIDECIATEPLNKGELVVACECDSSTP